MTRHANLLLYQAAGALLAWLVYPQGRAASWLVGLLVGTAIWSVVDARGERAVLRWLRNDDALPPYTGGGAWRPVAERIWRAVRQREVKAIESENRLAEFLAAIQASPNGVVLLDRSNRIEWCNETAAMHFGLDPQRDLMQLLANLVRDPAFTAYLSGGDYRHEVVIAAPRPDPPRPARLALHLHPYGRGRKLLLSRDVTALEQAETMRRDFVANVSHEIRTPLTVLSGFVETLQTLSLDEAERSRYLSLMAQQAHRMQTLVNDLLTLSRLEGSPPPGASEWLDLRTLMEQCEQEGRALARMLAHAHDQTLVFECQCDGEVAGAASELISATCNLVGNAIRYTPSGGRIEVLWHLLPDGRPEFRVRDTGPGIAPEHIPRITERFYRIDRSRSRETGGTGLGLAIVKHVLQRHGSELRIESTLGRGSTFAFALPLARFRPRATPGPERCAPLATEAR